MIFIATGMDEMPENCVVCPYLRKCDDVSKMKCPQTGETMCLEDAKGGRSDNCPLEEIDGDEY